MRTTTAARAASTGYPHRTGGYCGDPHCAGSSTHTYDGHQVWRTVEAYLRDHHTDGEECPNPLGCSTDPACRKRSEQVLSREIVATAQAHGGTRVIEFSVIRHTHGSLTWTTYRTAAYDSNHRDRHHSTGRGPADTPDQIEQARAAAGILLTPVSDSTGCDCWAGWDPHCGTPGCWGTDRS
ncbi:hypothetical protein [Lentzea cavernae]|uniref:HNH endonuclease n=1 Tax=Lentzea cavernae TaxID=2020703 RepID=A0ABQ3MXE3_9PSEU|nr:hypothetical protein [Lentzea cavernae]GHH57916.1 hypothetical protein GCM10017774_78430 [Lentzea cavernae]